MNDDKSDDDKSDEHKQEHATQPIITINNSFYC